MFDSTTTRSFQKEICGQIFKKKKKKRFRATCIFVRFGSPLIVCELKPLYIISTHLSALSHSYTRTSTVLPSSRPSIPPHIHPSKHLPTYLHSTTFTSLFAIHAQLYAYLLRTHAPTVIHALRSLYTPKPSLNYTRTPSYARTSSCTRTPN